MKKYILILVGILLPLTTRALEVSFPEVQGVKVGESMGPAEWIKYIFLLAQAMVGLAIIYTLTKAGFLWMTGGDKPGNITEAKDRAFGAVLGLVILLGSYLFLQTINPQLVNIKNPGINFGTDAPSGMIDFWTKLFITKHGKNEACGSDFDCSNRLVCKRENPRDSSGICSDTEGNTCDKDNSCEDEYFCIDPATSQSVPLNVAGPSGICTLKRPLGAACSKVPTETTTCFRGLVCQDTTGDNDYKCVKPTQEAAPSETQPTQ